MISCEVAKGFKRWFTETRSQHFCLNIHKQNPPPIVEMYEPTWAANRHSIAYASEGKKENLLRIVKTIKSKPKQSGSLSLPVACDHFNCFKNATFGPRPFGGQSQLHPSIWESADAANRRPASCKRPDGGKISPTCSSLNILTIWLQLLEPSWNWNMGFSCRNWILLLRSLFPLPWSWQECYPIIQSILSIGKTQDVGIQTKIAQIKSWAHWLW